MSLYTLFPHRKRVLDLLAHRLVTVFYFVRACAVFLQNVSVLGLMFVPKMARTYTGDDFLVPQSMAASSRRMSSRRSTRVSFGQPANNSDFSNQNMNSDESVQFERPRRSAIRQRTGSQERSVSFADAIDVNDNSTPFGEPSKAVLAIRDIDVTDEDLKKESSVMVVDNSNPAPFEENAQAISGSDVKDDDLKTAAPLDQTTNVSYGNGEEAVSSSSGQSDVSGFAAAALPVNGDAATVEGGNVDVADATADGNGVADPLRTMRR